MIARHLVRLLAGTANGAGNWPPGLRPNNKGKLSRSTAAPKRRPGLENGRSSSVRAEAVRLRPLVPNQDTSLVSVVPLPRNQRLSWEGVQKLVRHGTRTSVGIRGDCRSDSHSAMTLKRQASIKDSHTYKVDIGGQAVGLLCSTTAIWVATYASCTRRSSWTLVRWGG